MIVNLASLEYSRVALRPGLLARVVECRFEDFKAGQYKVISFFAKQARGMMARWAVQQRVNSMARLRQFEQDGYAYDKTASGANQLVFRRHLG